MLSVKNIEKSFGDKKVLDGISLTVKQGDVVVILGPRVQEKQLSCGLLIILKKLTLGS